VNITCSSFASWANIKRCCKDPLKLWKWALILKSKCN